MQHTSEGKISQNINSLAYLFKLSFQGPNQHTAFNTPAFQTLNMVFQGGILFQIDHNHLLKLLALCDVVRCWNPWRQTGLFLSVQNNHSGITFIGFVLLQLHLNETLDGNRINYS